MSSDEYVKYKRDQYTGVRKFGVIPQYKPLSIPPEVLADRDYRAGLVPRDITALICGDPLPGYAADQVRVASPSIQHDPLDDLMFGLRV